MGISACEMLEKQPAVQPDTETRSAPQDVTTSHQALQKVSTRDVFYAQTALKQLGYAIGTVDGIWGERSAAAMLAFEEIRGIRSAGGAISQLNLYELSRATKVRSSDIESTLRQRKSLRAKIDTSVPLSSAPQLIIVEQSYPVLAKANPYSEVLLTLQPGTGIYIIAEQDGWYEIESLQRLRGYIREN